MLYFIPEAPFDYIEEENVGILNLYILTFMLKFPGGGGVMENYGEITHMSRKNYVGSKGGGGRAWWRKPP